MEDFYIYIVKVNIAFFVFFLLYRMVMNRDTFFGMRRLFLWSLIILSFLYPFLSFSPWEDIQSPLQQVMVDYTDFVNIASYAVVPVENDGWTWQNWFAGVWCAGSLVLLFRMLLQITLVCRMAYQGKRGYCLGQKVIVLDRETAPFSFWHWIFLNPDSYEEKELQEILLHEKAHVVQWHSLDVLLGELLCIFFWFNPVIWLLKKDIHQNLEFLADRKVLAVGYDRKSYQYHLLRLSRQLTVVPIVNKFNVSSLKKRIIMMNKRRTSRISLIKYALLFPVTGLLILSANAGRVAEMAESTFQEWKMSPEKDTQKEGKVLTGKVVDQDGKSLPGVSVIVRGTGIGTLTDADGKFQLKVDEPGVLGFSYVGKQTEYCPYDMKSKEFRIKLVDADLELDKVIVVGYSEEKEPEAEQEVFVVVEEMPSFSMGLPKYFAKELRYPASAQSLGIEGTVKVSFVVNHQGKVTDAKVIQSVDASLDKEALRVINSMPDWKPGKQRGKAVDVRFSFPVEFRLMHAKNKD